MSAQTKTGLDSTAGFVPGQTAQRTLLSSDPPECQYTGKIEGVLYNNFGDFEGFILRTDAGLEHLFPGREENLEHLVRTAWSERFVISVAFRQENEPPWPVAVMVRRTHL